MSVPELLNEKAELFKEKGKIYGHTYKDFGKFLNLFFPDGLKIKGTYELNKLGLFNMLMHKIIRISKMLFISDECVIDSIKDLQVYSAMLEEIIYTGEKNENSN